MEKTSILNELLQNFTDFFGQKPLLAQITLGTELFLEGYAMPL